ncbi:uncharacterized protein G2W53_033520 [Senna tora]|uniref:Uncharacterized protein n=1 Tax=Senna tora TaxID=362788 RepID=A0A834SYM9_9FABA|nr:uncharacterized protein G2W53_033520 [Senna tora]
MIGKLPSGNEIEIWNGDGVNGEGNSVLGMREGKERIEEKGLGLVVEDGRGVEEWQGLRLGGLGERGVHGSERERDMVVVLGWVVLRRGVRVLEAWWCGGCGLE